MRVISETDIKFYLEKVKNLSEQKRKLNINLYLDYQGLEYFINKLCDKCGVEIMTKAQELKVIAKKFEAEHMPSYLFYKEILERITLAANEGKYHLFLYPYESENKFNINDTFDFLKRDGFDINWDAKEGCYDISWENV